MLFLVIVLACTQTVQMILNVPVGEMDWIAGERSGECSDLGLMFSGLHRELYARINPIAREYVFNKLERRFQYNITVLLDTFDVNQSDIDTWSRLCAQLSNGIMSIIGHINYENYDWVAGFCTTYQVPFLGLDNHEYIPKNYYISIMPDILPALVAFIRRYQITQLVYLYDDTTGAHRLKQLMKMQTTNKLKNLNIVTRYLGQPDDPYDLLQNIEILKSSAARYIVLDFHSFETYRIVMDKIKHRGMTTADYHYILLTLNAKQLDMNYFRYGGVNVTFFALPSYHDITSKENYINSLGDNPPFESLLIADAWETLLRTINHMLSSANETRDKLKVFRQGRFYNGLTPGIDCRNSQIQAWSAGKIYLDHLLNTTFHGLTGRVQFSPNTGQRTNYTFEVYRVARNDLPKHIGYFRDPTTFEVGLI